MALAGAAAPAPENGSGVDSARRNKIIASVVGGVVAVLAAAWFTNRGGPNCQVARVACLTGVGVVALAATLSGIPIDGLRGVSPMVLMGTLHAIFAIRSGPRPLGEDQARVVKATSAPDGE